MNEPMPFAILATGHAAFRTGMEQMREFLEQGKVHEFVREWNGYKQALKVHMVLEDRGVFPLLRGSDPAPMDAANLEAEHVEDLALQEKIEAAIAAAGTEPGALQEAFLAWRQDHLNHLEHEETIVVPRIPTIGSNAQERSLIFSKSILSHAVDHPDFAGFLGWSVKKLQEHGTPKRSPLEATRAFVEGLQHGSTPEQWRRCLPILKENLSATMVRELQSQFDMESEGKVRA